MAQLGRLSYPVQDTSGNAIAGASVAVYREGATVNGNQSGAAPTTFNVRHRGKIVTGDNVFVNAATGTLYAATVVSATQITLAGYSGTLSLTAGDRLTPAGSQPTLYADDQGGASTSNPLTSSSTGRAQCWIEYGAYDLVLSGGGLTAAAFTSEVMPTEAQGQIRYADEFSGGTTGGIQEALNDLPSTGGLVMLSGNKTYAVTTEITIPADVAIRGCGNSSVIQFGAVNLRLTNATNAGGIRLSDFKIDANGDTHSSTVAAINFSTGTGSNYLIRNVTVDDAAHSGMRMVGAAGTRTNMTVDGCTVTNCDRHGIEYSSDMSYSKVVNCFLSGNNVTTVGAQLYLGSDTTSNHLIASNNIVYDSKDNGIRLRGTDCVVSNNIVNTAVIDGIRLNGSRHTCTGNVVRTITESGIKWDDLNDSTVTGNSCSACTIHGIHGRITAASGNNAIMGNVCQGNTLDGIRIGNVSADETETVIVGNMIQGNGNNGITIQAGAIRFVVIGNLVQGSGVQDISDAGTATQFMHNSIGASGLRGGDEASGATVTLDPHGEYFQITGTNDITSITASWPGRLVTLQFTGTAATTGLTDGSNLVLAGNLGYTPNDTITLRSDGTNWIETARSVN